MNSYFKCIHMLYNPTVEMAILKQKPLFVRIEFTENMFYASIHFPNLQLLSFGQKVGNLVYCLKARKDCLS